ncbi:MAG: lysophospholipid acyltransferase family protein [Nitrospinota bacterium]|nr:lysophospholipid acyltransferase family protein [Nitrospinota bacterium]
MKGIKHYVLTLLVVPLAYILLRLLCGSVRLRVEGAEHEEELDRNGKPAIACCWHGRVLFIPFYYSLVRRKSRIMDALTSMSEDGEFVAGVAGLFGFGIVRGSTYKNSRSALRTLARSVTQGRWPGIIADGSRGPALVAQPGAMMLSKLTGAPVIPVTVSFDRYWTLKSWDRMIIPKPFARGLVIHGAPILFPAGGGRAELDAGLEELNRALARITHRADAAFTAP